MLRQLAKPGLSDFLKHEGETMSAIKKHRPDHVLERNEYLSRVHEFCHRGESLPQSKLTEEKVLLIRSAALQRKNLQKYISDNLSAKALAKQFNITESTVEKVTQRYSWIHL